MEVLCQCHECAYDSVLKASRSVSLTGYRISTVRGVTNHPMNHGNIRRVSRGTPGVRTIWLNEEGGRNLLGSGERNAYRKLKNLA